MSLLRRTFRTAGVLGGATAIGLGLYGYILSRRYPWAPQPAIQTSPAITACLPPGLGEVETLVTTVPLTNQPLATFLDAFYASWSARLESWVARKLAYKSILPSPGTGREFASGLFPELYADNHVSVHWWSAPTKNGMGPAGAHIFSAIQRGDGVEVALSTTQLQPPYAPKDPWVVGVLHGFYMRVVFDETRRRIERWAREARDGKPY